MRVFLVLVRTQSSHELVGQKPHIVLLNKVDLADPKATKEWTEFFTKQGIISIGYRF